MTEKSPDLPEECSAQEPPRSRGARAVADFLLLLIRIYQLMISPFFGACCRFEPSCSRYAATCIRRLGPIRGVWLTTCRLGRCHPFCEGGYDPPPSSSPGGQV